MPTRKEIRKKLSDLGRGELENFNMSEDERLTNAGAIPVNGYSPETGYCHGVCLDWIRRVLQGGRPRFGPNPERNAEEGYDYHARLQQQAKRQGYAWASFNLISDRNIERSNTQMARNKADYDRAYDDYVKEKRLLQQLNSKLVDDYIANEHFGETHVVKIDYGAALLRAFPQLKTARNELTVRNLRGLYQKVEEMYNSLAAPVKVTVSRADIDQRSFEAFTKLMDAKFAKKRKFEGITLIKSYPKKQYGSLANAIDAVTSPVPTDFCNSRAMIVGFGMTNGQDRSGHALAVYWHPRDFYILLDPNYGMFIYERLAGDKSISSAMDYLFGTAYPAEPGVRVTNAVEYEIFAKRDDD